MHNAGIRGSHEEERYIHIKDSFLKSHTLYQYCTSAAIPKVFVSDNLRKLLQDTYLPGRLLLDSSAYE